MHSSPMQMADFQNAVDAKLRQFNEAFSPSEVDGFVSAIAGQRDPDEMDWISGAADRGGTPPRKRGAPRFVKDAHQIIQQPNVRQRLCAALLSGTGDAFDIGKTLVPILIPLSLAGTIAVPVTPVVVAAVALTIARMGVGAFCTEPTK